MLEANVFFFLWFLANLLFNTWKDRENIKQTIYTNRFSCLKKIIMRNYFGLWLKVMNKL